MKKTIILALIICTTACQRHKPAPSSTLFDWQGHRGARGLLPENTIPAFLKALDLGVTTLELDLAVSKDSQLIVSHEPWLNADICQNADNTPVSKDEAEKRLLWHMSAEEIHKYDCGSRGNPRFPSQQRMRVFKPTLTEMVEAVKTYCRQKNRALPYFNMEIKTQPEWDNKRTPSVKAFVQLVLKTLKRLKIEGKTCIQSFDTRALEAVHQLNKQMVTAYLVENTGNINSNLAKLSFTPHIYSPHYVLVDKKLVDVCHSQKMRILPWTVNEVEDMKKLVALGVDGLITDYPNRIPR
ncbi:MAG: glycerophosphodiester phosphodiesterase [Saprospiraceae bacterium]|nr:glycerophosphodiester phosphodiesterase [Saprospiraceae bacterium]